MVPGRNGGTKGPQPGYPREKPLDAPRHRFGGQALLLSTASLVEIDRDGHTVSHKWFMISGHDQSGAQTGTVESIDFADARPRWQKVGSILQPLATTKAVLLPDGKVLIGQGVNRSPGCSVDGRPCTFEEREGHQFQMFDPATGSVAKLAKTTVVARPSRHRDAAAGRLGVLRRRESGRAGSTRRPVVPADELVRRAASTRGSDQGVPVGQCSPALPVQS